MQSLAGVKVLLFLGCGFVFLSSFYLIHRICNQKNRNMIGLCPRKDTGRLYSWDIQTKICAVNVLNADVHNSILTCIGVTFSLKPQRTKQTVSHFSLVYKVCVLNNFSFFPNRKIKREKYSIQLTHLSYIPRMGHTRYDTFTSNGCDYSPRVGLHRPAPWKHVWKCRVRLQNSPFPLVGVSV